MKYNIITVLAILVLSSGFTSCNPDNPLPETEKPEIPWKPDDNIPDEPDDEENNEHIGTKLNIRFGTTVLTVTLEDNATVTAFKKMLPVTLNMSELNGNEKFHYLSAKLLAAASPPGIINAGDLMLYGSDCLVIFYKTFQTSYSYTRLGAIDNPSEFEHLADNGNITVEFELITNQ